MESFIGSNSNRMFLLVLLIIISQCVLKCHANTLSAENPGCVPFPQAPKLKILSDSEDFLAGDGRIINKKPLYLQCSAAYPIYWDFIPPSAFTYDISSKVRDNCYTETLSIWINNTVPVIMKYDRTGNYSCISGLDKNVRTWTFLHIRDSDNLFRHKVDVHEYAESADEDHWSIPCISNIKQLDQAILSLKNGTMETALSANYTKYDPEFGFLLQKSHFPRPSGDFECRGVLGTVVDICNISLKTFNVIPKWPYVVYTNNNTIEILCESDEDIRLDLSKAYKLKTISSSKTINEMQPFKYSLKTVLQEHESGSMILPHRRAQFNNVSGLISCVTVNSSKILHSWKHDFTKIIKCEFKGPREEAISGESSFISYMDSLRGSCENIFGSSSVRCEYAHINSPAINAVVHQHFHLLNSLDINILSSYNNVKNYTTTAVRCLTYTDVYQFTSSVNIVATDSGYKVNPMPLDKQKNLKVYVRENEIVNNMIGDIIKIWCVASRYIFSDSIYWMINYKNGTSIPFDEGFATEYKGRPTPTDYPYVTPLQWAYLDSVYVELDEVIHSVSCSAVVWNSTEVITGNYTLELNHTKSDPYKLIHPKELVKCDWLSPVISMRTVNRYNYNIAYGSKWIRLAMYNVTDVDVKITTSFYEYPLVLCTAPYPVEWAYEESEIPSDMYQTEVNFGNNSLNNLSPCFQISISHAIGYAIRRTGPYTCRKKNHFSTFSTVYFYVKRSFYDNKGQFINSEEPITVFVDVEDPLTIFPCRVNDPDASVDLYYHDRPGVYRKLSDSEFELYDPKIGFYMDTSKLKKSETYMCTINNNNSSLAMDPQASLFISIAMAQTNSSLKGLNADALSQFKERDFLFPKELDRTRSEFLTFQVVMLIALILILAVLMWFAKRIQRSDELTSRSMGMNLSDTGYNSL